jgi:hypothetical protein
MKKKEWESKKPEKYRPVFLQITDNEAHEFA